MSISLANADPSTRPSTIFLQHIRASKWGYAIYRTNYDPALEAAWTHTLHASIEDARIRNDPSLCPAVDPAPVNAVKARLELAVHDDAARYAGLSTEGVREAFHALCTGGGAPSVAEVLAHPQPVRKRTGLPVSADVCLMVDGEVLRAVSRDMRN
ncbi:hypothetical protein PENSUB_3669 [Aspergillus terreus]|uniref:Uncharacterized protein n=1 Tax=Aspergillus terreus TaxID=33178 RepID=A0A5M3YP33_ASPTE|nr:hypothetical protein ATETN484_0002035900 [Aspergillus terreus]GFF15215.1 hypothetical protein PENSUB_3669 [Aspergillus terreus]